MDAFPALHLATCRKLHPVRGGSAHAVLDLKYQFLPSWMVIEILFCSVFASRSFDNHYVAEPYFGRAQEERKTSIRSAAQRSKGPNE